ncbi:carboxymuconolactone decarboxylase family protein [Allopontixanthobacter sp.]|uniref:carboxymuconolactone decarboxylase family protein n=1 Tax=Allopontixanthobacter sp. TaxID=2906452 RepID=UPI002AB9ADE4|nr:carboxymuconolactone decarboxylase family protein [Allopontixanthobacter sp.]MDZ4307218.1 carboxymuconolactone decarboxylase family protein [Allopontixanthobacter sp.]
MSQLFKTTLPLRTADDADPAVAGPLKDTQAKMGMVPNMYGAMANLPALLDTYSHAYGKFRAEAGFTPVEQEVVFLAISRANGCHYCMAAHSFVGDMMTKVPAEVTDAIRDGRPVGDAKLEALRAFAHIMTESRGNPSPAEARAFLDAGFTETHILGIILALSAKVISNYTNHIFHTELDPAFAGRAWTPEG